MDIKKKNKLIVIGSLGLIAVFFLSVFVYYHPTHFSYNDRFIIGNTQENIVEKYGDFYHISENQYGEITCGIYKIRDNTPELIMSYDDSLWYEIYFENGMATKVILRKGYIGG